MLTTGMSPVFASSRAFRANRLVNIMSPVVAGVAPSATEVSPDSAPPSVRIPTLFCKALAPTPSHRTNAWSVLEAGRPSAPTSELNASHHPCSASYWVVSAGQILRCVPILIATSRSFT